MANSGNSIKDQAIREIAASSLTTAYQPLGGPMTTDSFRIWQTNASNGDVYLSTDGVTDHKKMPAMSGRALDEKTNDMFRAKGTQWYVRFAATVALPKGWVALEVEYV